MNVSHQNTDNLNAVISIEISKADYQTNLFVLMGKKRIFPDSEKGKFLLVCS